jgi:hypothetical protein
VVFEILSVRIRLEGGLFGNIWQVPGTWYTLWLMGTFLNSKRFHTPSWLLFSGWCVAVAMVACGGSTDSTVGTTNQGGSAGQSGSSGTSGTSGTGGTTGTGGTSGMSGAAGTAGTVPCGPGGIACPPTHYCQASGEVCGLGTCMPKPDVCPASCSQEGICGCDGMSYCSSCSAHAAGVGDTGKPCGTGGAGGTGGSGGAAGTGGSAGIGGTSGTAGAGGQSMKVCGGIAGLTCADNEYCDFPSTAAECGGDDGQGVCVLRPAVCPLGCSQQGICGCDGNSYCNGCEAHANGFDDTGKPCPGGNIQEGKPCQQDTQCVGMLKCCYPCGTPGCQNVCTNTNGGDCPLLP